MNPKYILDFTLPLGPTGPTGPQGETGPQRISGVYLATLNQNYVADGIEVLENARLPIQRKEVDNDNICLLDTNDNTIQFNKEGNYRIDFIVSGYVDNADDQAGFNPDTDFISVGFRKVSDTVIFAGGSKWYYDETPSEITGHGMFIVTDIAEPFELVNLSKRSIYLNSPNLVQTNSTSYFTNPLVSIVIQYLG